MNPPSTPRLIVSVGGITVIVKVAVGAGPVETTRFTDEPTVTDAPASGDSLITPPEGTVLLDAVNTVPTTRPVPVIEVVAALWVSPTTFGTNTFAGPLETTRFTDEPTATDVPASGASLITLPEGTVFCSTPSIWSQPPGPYL